MGMMIMKHIKSVHKKILSTGNIDIRYSIYSVVITRKENDVPCAGDSFYISFSLLSLSAW